MRLIQLIKLEELMEEYSQMDPYERRQKKGISQAVQGVYSDLKND